MTTKLIVPTIADLGDEADGYMLDVSGDEQYLNFYSAGVIGRNLVDGGPTPSVVGTPAISGGLAQFGLARGAYVDTGVTQPTGDFTILAAARANPADVWKFIVANWESPSRGGFFLGFGPPGTFVAFATVISDGGTPSPHFTDSPLGVSPGGTYCVAARYNATTRLKTLNNLTTGLSVTNTTDHPMLAEASNRVLVGVNHSTYASEVDVGCVLIYDRLLSDAELALEYAQIRAVMAARGVAV